MGGWLLYIAHVHHNQFAIYKHAYYLICRECLGPIIGGALVYRVGFRTMTAVRRIGVPKPVILMVTVKHHPDEV